MSQTLHVPARSEIAAEFKWQLEAIYPTDADWEQEFDQTRAMLEEVASYRGQLGQSAAVLLAALQIQDQISLRTERLATYARMRRDEDNTNAVYQALANRVESLAAQVQSALSYYLPEILDIPAPTLDAFLLQEPELAPYKFALEEIQRQKPHVLSAAEEQILAAATEIAEAGANIFRMLNDADLTFPDITDEQGQQTAVTHGRFIKLMESSHRQVRRDAFLSLYGTYRRFINTIAASYGASVKKDVFFARVRRYPSALEASLFDDNIEPEVYHNLIQTVRRSLPLLHRYVKLRRKLLSLPQLHMYDLYTPVIAEVKWEFTYPEAIAAVTRGLAPLGADYLQIMEQGLQNGWVDVYENRGKTSGAYSWGPYGVHPYVLLNYQGRLNDVFTLAHELGHAMHSHFSHQRQPYVSAHYNIFTAEVASTVNETLLIQDLLQNTTEKKKKLYLLNHYLEQFRGTVFRQTMFAEFEKITHAKAEAGEALTPELLSQVYHGLNRDYYGPEMAADQEIELEWARIPHFYRAFYVYKYATGFSAATALAGQIKKQGTPALNRYLDFLAAGGSDYPLELLRSAGVDMSTPQPIQETLDLFAAVLNELETLTDANA